MDNNTINTLCDIRNAVRANPDAATITAALAAIAEQGVDTADLDTPRAICRELTDIINDMYWDMQEENNMNNITTSAAAVTLDATAAAITDAATITAVNAIIKRQGGYREKSLLTAPREYRRGETWNSDHRVIEIIETAPDIDGYCHGCAVDIVTKSIVG